MRKPGSAGAFELVRVAGCCRPSADGDGGLLPGSSSRRPRKVARRWCACTGSLRSCKLRRVARPNRERRQSLGMELKWLFTLVLHWLTGSAFMQARQAGTISCQALQSFEIHEAHGHLPRLQRAAAAAAAEAGHPPSVAQWISSCPADRVVPRRLTSPGSYAHGAEPPQGLTPPVLRRPSSVRPCRPTVTVERRTGS